MGGLVVWLLLFLLVCSPEQTGWLSATSAWDFASASCPGSLFSRLLAYCSCLFIFLFFLFLFLRASLACSDSGALSPLSLGPALEATDTPLQAESRRTRGAKLAKRGRGTGPGGWVWFWWIEGSWSRVGVRRMSANHSPHIRHMSAVGPDRNSGPVPVPVEFGPVPRFFSCWIKVANITFENRYFKISKSRNVIFYEI